MNSTILQISSKYVRALLLIFATLALLRGHNMPGGGFIGGLLAALSVIVSSLAYSPHYVYTKMRMKPDYYIAAGLSLVLLSSIPSQLYSESLLKGFWYKIDTPFFSELKVGTPLIFDTGVFFAVIGVTLSLYFTLSIKK